MRKSNPKGGDAYVTFKAEKNKHLIDCKRTRTYPQNLGIDIAPLLQILGQVQPNRTIQFVDNQLSLFAAQYGRCAVTGESLTANTLYTHHKKPKELGGTDDYKNLVIVTSEVHALIHGENPNQVQTLLDALNLNQEQTVKINKLRKLAGVKPL
ncbi:MAG: HNH endonuclease signature motif containing protein [Eubacteriales bacterium]